MKAPQELVLASHSPRRLEILRLTGIPFRVLKPKGVIENPLFGEKPHRLAARLACEKAGAVAQLLPRSLVLGADTIVVCQGKIFGKPKNHREAWNTINSLQGRSHLVWTGVALVWREKGTSCTYLEKTEVYFRKLSPREIKNYLSTSEPYDKAGGYAIQGTAGKWIEKWKGDYFNVMGLPLGWVMKETNRLFNRSEKF